MGLAAAAGRTFERRSTLYRIGLLSVAVAASTLGWASAPPPDLVLVGGVVYTVDAARPWAEGLAIIGGRISAVGSSSEIRALAGPDTRVIELGGAFVTPGFNDGHVHVASTGALLVGVNLLDVHEPESFTERVAAAAQRMPAGSWITGGSWGAYEQWAHGSAGAEDDPAGARDHGPFTPHRDLIDDVTPEHPVLLSKFDRSMFLANTLALQLAGIDESTPVPQGGEIIVGADGRLTGGLTGAAVGLVRVAIAPKSLELRTLEFEAVLREAREGGITTIQDITSADMLRVYQATRARGALTARIMIRPSLDNVVHTAGLGITKGFGDDWLKFTGYKAWVDGIMGGSSALFFRDYDHDPGNRGALRQIMLPESVSGAAMSMGPDDHYTAFPPGNLERLLEVAVDTGIPPHVHAIGMLGVRMILDIYERVLTAHDMVESDHRWRVIHGQVVMPEDFARFGALHLVAEVNPYHVSDDMRWMQERIGKERSQGAYGFRQLKDAGAVLVFGSDSPGTNAARYYLSPMYGLYAAVTRQTLSGEPAGGWFPEQRLSIEEAIEAYTANPAWACFQEDAKGTLTTGKLADIAVFDTNLVVAGHDDPTALLRAKVLYTIVGGRIVYQR